MRSRKAVVVSMDFRATASVIVSVPPFWKPRSYGIDNESDSVTSTES